MPDPSLVTAMTFEELLTLAVERGCGCDVMAGHVCEIHPAIDEIRRRYSVAVRRAEAVRDTPVVEVGASTIAGLAQEIRDVREQSDGPYEIRVRPEALLNFVDSIDEVAQQVVRQMIADGHICPNPETETASYADEIAAAVAPDIARAVLNAPVLKRPIDRRIAEPASA